ncbi:unnamed protein product [Allacma fusca]|uniref:G-protein coupled receptors family 3 profile domain-containing protein n=1 Tax=Allacma fusca TaxID=39272 RepID=A0A8J2JK63_9HEXA|nr:unnamed protein product [Allacma fusca]
MRAGMAFNFFSTLSNRVWLFVYYWVVVASILASSSVSTNNNDNKNVQLDYPEETQVYALTEQLRGIESIFTCAYGTLCSSPSSDRHRFFPNVSIGANEHLARLAKEKINVIAALVRRWTYKNSTPRNSTEERELIGYILQTMQSAPAVRDVRFVMFFSEEQASGKHWLYKLNLSTTDIDGNNWDAKESVHVQNISTKDLKKSPWFLKPPDPSNDDMNIENKFDERTAYRHSRIHNSNFPGPIFGHWTWPYFLCSRRINNNSHGRVENIDTDTLSNTQETAVSNYEMTNHKSNQSWPKCEYTLEGHFLVSYTSAFLMYNQSRGIYGIISFDMDLSNYSINQCDYASEEEMRSDKAENPLHVFRGTHKCDRNTSLCEFKPGRGWRQGSYNCSCNKSHYAFKPDWNNTVAGDNAEMAWWDWKNLDDNQKYYEDLVTCKRCPEGCEDCIDGESCLAEISWVFRIGLLSVSMVSITCTVGIILIVYKYRRVPVLKSSSPIFHCIVLVGCIIMYTEMVALFPVLTMQSCVAVKWTRHLGFCITYTALYMKLCRVYLTFRVKSAHKIKLTEKHLLHWMSPIMVIMLLYLFAWTLSSPPGIQVMETTDKKRFIQCVYNWWDHALATGEVIFLSYGVWICYRIRENPDAQFISYSIYNIAIINILMAALHLIILPNAGPDVKYLFAFIRTQMSTTITIALVFGSKLYCVLWGKPKELKEMPSSANGFGHDTLDLAEENQQLKEELQKLAGQMERLKCYAMGKNNPHLKQSSANISNADLEFNSNRLETFTTL